MSAQSVDINEIIELYDQQNYNQILSNSEKNIFDSLKWYGTSQWTHPNKIMAYIIIGNNVSLADILFTRYPNDFDYAELLIIVVDHDLEEILRMILANNVAKIRNELVDNPKSEFSMESLTSKIVDKLDLIKIFIEYGFEPNDIFIKKIITCGIYSDKPAVLQYLFEYGSDIQSVWDDSMPSLNCLSPNLEMNHLYLNLGMIHLLMNLNIDIFKHIRALIMIAIRSSNLDLVKFCTDNGADLNYLDGQLLRDYPNLEIASYLLANGADPGLVTMADLVELIRSEDFSPAWDAQLDAYLFIKLLVDNGLDISDKLDTLLINSIIYKNYNLVVYLTNFRIDIQTHDNLALFAAAYYGQEKILELLLEMGADIHANHDKILSFISNSTDPICTGIHMRTDAYVPDKPGRYVENFSIIFRFLIGRGAIISDPHTLILILADLMITVGPDIIDYFINCGTDINMLYELQLKPPFNNKTICISSALEASIYANKNKITKLLIEYGADYTVNSNNPLKLAIRSSNLEIIKLLLDCGADLDLKFESGVFPDVIDILESRGIVGHSLQVNKYLV